MLIVATVIIENLVLSYKFNYHIPEVKSIKKRQKIGASSKCKKRKLKTVSESSTVCSWIT
jgi:hypothetical protein